MIRIIKRSFRKLTRWLRPPRLDLPFSREDATRFLPWIMALMVFLAALLLAAAITLDDTMSKSTMNYRARLTVEVPYQAESMQKNIDKVLAELHRMEEVESASVREKSEVKKMVAPWLGEGEVIDLLPMPALIEVKTRLSDDGPLLREAWEERLRGAVPGVNVDDHKQWVDNFARFTRTIQSVAYLIAGMIIATLAAIIMLAAKTSLKLHHEGVELLHGLGARDRYIARQFQINAFYLAMRGALTGTVAALALYMSLSLMAVNLDAPLLPALTLTSAHVQMFLLLPFLVGFTALISSRYTVLSLLKRMM